VIEKTKKPIRNYFGYSTKKQRDSGADSHRQSDHAVPFFQSNKQQNNNTVTLKKPQRTAKGGYKNRSKDKREREREVGLQIGTK
jgi:hypothetical protein